jgi:two-component system chemotaxis response regulator CheY
VRKYLQELGCTSIAAATSGEKALEIARVTPPSVVVSALHLSDMTGVQLAEKLWSEKALSGVGFVLITSQSDAEDANVPKAAGALVRLTKPFDAARLGTALTSVGHSHPPRPSSRRVLVVDDSAAARTHIRRVLSGLGMHDIVEVEDGAEAVALLEKQTFELVVTDFNMPRLDGRGLIEFIRHRSAISSVPVIMVTTETDKAKLDAVRRLGVAAICDKSFPPDVVGSVIAKLG